MNKGLLDKVYKIVFSDLDGTLLNKQHLISENTIAKIRTLSYQGIPFIFVSARSPGGMAHIAASVGIPSPIVCYSGALILDHERQVIKSTPVKRETARQVIESIKGQWPQVSVSLYSGYDWYTDSVHDRRVCQERDITGVVPVQVSFQEILKRNIEIHKLYCLCSKEEGEALEKGLTQQFPMLAVHRSGGISVEIMDQSANKAEAAAILCDTYQIDLKEAVAFGDNFNDIDMLKAVGLGAAMGNAPKEVQRQADYITLDNQQEGVLHLLNKLAFVSGK